jgi:hypothetical protein
MIRGTLWAKRTSPTTTIAAKHHAPCRNRSIALAIPNATMDGDHNSLWMIVGEGMEGSVHSWRHSVRYERVLTAAIMVELILLAKWHGGTKKFDGAMYDSAY